MHIKLDAAVHSQRTVSEGMLLSTSATASRKEHVHFKNDQFVISSSIPIGDMQECTLYEHVLPGELGRYFYPSDAVLEVVNCRGAQSISKFLKEYVQKCKQPDDALAKSKHIRCITLPIHEDEPEVSDHEDSDWASSGEEDDNDNPDVEVNESDCEHDDDCPEICAEPCVEGDDDVDEDGPLVSMKTRSKMKMLE